MHPLLRPLPRIWLLLTALSGPAGAAEFVGQLDPMPARGTRSHVKLRPASPEQLARIPDAVPPEAKVWAPARVTDIKGRKVDLLVVAMADGACEVWIDRDGDGALGRSEKLKVVPGGNAVQSTLPWDNGFIREFPLEISLDRIDPFGGPNQPAAEPTRITSFSHNFNVIFGATVDLDGRPLRVTFAPRPAESAIDLETSRISLDANLDGKIDAAAGEVVNPSGKSAVFRVGSRYLAVRSVDMATGRVIVGERPASEYTRFEALPGQQMPDFEFTTLDGVKHRLADLRGKLVLLDFWGTWCGPCIVEMKHLDPLYEKYRTRGFEVIGMNMEKTSGGLTPEAYTADEAKVRTFLAKAGHQWLQATQRSIERFAIDVIAVNSYPTCILIGPDGKVLSREARGKVLEDLLAKHLP